MRLISTFFFFNDTATTEIYTLSLHDALPICGRHPALARLSLRGHPRRRALPLPRGDPSKLSPHRRARPALQEDLLHAALPPVRRRPARLPVHPVGQPHLHAEGLEGPLLPDRRPALPHLEGVLRRRRLGLLGDAPGPALPQLQDALGLRGIGGAEAGRALLRRAHDGALAAGERA